jgi:hypothetical protein
MVPKRKHADIENVIAVKLYQKYQDNGNKLNSDDVVNVIGDYANKYCKGESTEQFKENVLKTLLLESESASSGNHGENSFVLHVCNKLVELNNGKHLDILGTAVKISTDKSLQLAIMSGLMSSAGLTAVVDRHLPTLNHMYADLVMQNISDIADDDLPFLGKLDEQYKRIQQSTYGDDELRTKKMIALRHLAIKILKNSGSKLEEIINTWKTAKSSDPNFTNDQLLSQHRRTGLRSIFNYFRTSSAKSCIDEELNKLNRAKLSR